MKQIDKFPHDERVQVILRDMDDSPHVLRFTREPLGLPRHGKIKKVFLFSTAYYSYMLKAKALSFYARWPNNQLIVHACDRELFIGTSKSVSNQFQMDKMTFALRKGGVDENDFSAVKLEGSCASYVAQVESWMRELAAEAREGMGKVTPSEIPDVNEDARKVRGKGGELKDSDSDRSDEEGLSVWTRAHQQQQMLHSRPREGDIAGLLQKAPSRYLQVTSIVDGEFTDYSTLKSVYMNNGEDVLLADLATFVQENKGQVEKLCERYYPTFLHVARQCFFISESDAELVGQELSGATALVRSTVMELKRATEDLNVSQSVNNNVAQVRSLLQNALELAEQLETVEVRLRERKLLAAAVSLKQLLQIATPLSGFALGDYVTQNRVPKIAQEIFTCAVQELNGWFRLLRELSHSIGMAALNWKGVVEPGCVEKKLHVTEEAEWWVEVSCASASIRRAPFDEADGIAKILHGAAMQEIFEELGCGAFYRHYYTESRAQQVRLDLYDAPLKTSGVSGDVLVADMERYCATALGFMLIEDIVHHVTNPHVQSLMEILSMWEQISHAVAARVQRVADALTSSVSYSEWIVHMLRLLRRFVNITVDSVSCARLNPGVISRAVETLSDGIISTCLQEACVGANEAVLCDTFLPLYPRDMEEYEAFVSRFYLDRCKHLELPVPSGARIASGVSLPYALAVPKIGEIAIHFLERCHSIIEVNHGAAVWQSEYNNADEMLLKYLSVLFRTVTGTLQERLTSISDREIVLIAVYVTSCASMSVIISCVEQQFMLAWPIDYGGIHQRQKLGEPQLLKSSAALFEKALQGGIERLLTALIAAADIRVKPTADINYWKQLVAISSGATASPSTGTVGDSYEDRVKKGFPEAIEYLIDLIPVLMEILQISVTRSVIGTAITHAAITTQSNFEQAIYSGCGETNASGFSVLRSCVSEFERLCAVHVPRWQERIETMISGISVVQRFPLRPRQVADNLLAWIARKEAAMAGAGVH
ncbi:hypothetical protein ERJ75_001197200 [Trypanosoma vivax]|nr:hypothetical protein ERJ75_001197200 [Trypanosoma vivax]